MYITDISSSNSLTPDRNEWQQKSNKLEFYWFDGDCLLQLVLDAIVNKQSEDTGENGTGVFKQSFYVIVFFI